jgi:hypothetical protein
VSVVAGPAARLRAVTHRYGKTLALDGVDLESRQAAWWD